ncbi:hypothetical protein C8Q76DRAFT_797312 [Earliella scabrosa]|nr:hypothetical protein C8Q76DRAFT_797312 [Earliella scabrosa]
MKTIKRLFSPSKTCSSCKKTVQSSDEVFCSVRCARKQEYVQISREHSCKLSRTRPHSPEDLDSIIDKVRGSPSREIFSTCSSDMKAPYSPSSTRSRTQSTLPTKSNRDKPGRPRPLAHIQSTSDHPRSRSQSQSTHRSPPPPYHTHMLSSPSPSLPDSDSDCSPRQDPLSLRYTGWSPRPRRGQHLELDESSETGWSPTRRCPQPPIPFSLPSNDREPVRNNVPWSEASPTLVNDSPHPLRTRHNQSTSDLLHTARPALARSPLSDPSARPRAVTNALGLTVTPFLVRQPTNTSSFTPQRRPKPHPRYQDGALQLRPGYAQRRGPRPRSNSFGGFQFSAVRAH